MVGPPNPINHSSTLPAPALVVTMRAGRMSAVKAAETVVGLRRKLAQLLPSFIASLPPIRHVRSCAVDGADRRKQLAWI